MGLIRAIIANWIAATLTIYFVGLLFFTLQDDGSVFWTNYFYVALAYLTTISLLFNFKKRKSLIDMSSIISATTFRTLYLVYFLIGWSVYGELSWMDRYIVFWAILGVSLFSSMVYVGYKNGRK